MWFLKTRDEQSNIYWPIRDGLRNKKCIYSMLEYIVKAITIDMEGYGDVEHRNIIEWHDWL